MRMLRKLVYNMLLYVLSRNSKQTSYKAPKSTYVVDVLWGQPIKQNQVASTSELLENHGTTLFSSKSFPRISAGPQKPQKLTALKIKSEKFGPKILIPR